ncbi:MAG TPA: stalk domain-containing protein [Capsulimonadaceae bacterium]|jgi:hypothetical protein
MSKRFSVQLKLAALVAGASVLAATAPAAFAQAPISVVINDKPMVFADAQPMEMNGSVLVPLRGVFEQLGASVQYNGMTRTIEAVRGSTDVILRLGQDTAYINNAAQPLTQAPIVSGSSTMVPLRFVAQAFGATVNWVAASRTVVINTAGSTSTPITADKGGNISGQIVNVTTSALEPQIVVRSEGRRIVVPIAGNTLILLQKGKEPASEVSISQLLPGDTVQVSRDAAGGPASVIRANYNEVRGPVKSVGKLLSGSHVLTLGSPGEDSTLEIVANAPITADGRAVSWGDIHVRDIVAVRVDTANSVGYAVNVLTNAASVPQPTPAPDPEKPVTINSIRVDGNGPLKGAENLRVVIRGTEGGRATFAVPGIVDSVPMTETSPGVYQGNYPVPQGVNINGGAVLGRLTTRGGGQPVLIQAGQTVTIDSKPPVVSNEIPSSTGEVSNGRPRISATLDDGSGSGIDPNASKVFLDGRDVTNDAIIQPHFVTYQSNSVLSDGDHRVRLLIVDAVGNATSRDWTFTVAASKGLVTSLESNLAQSGNRLTPGKPLRVTLRAQPGGRASFSISGVEANTPMTETSPGVYTGEYIARVGATAKNAPVDVKFISKSGAVVTTPLDAQLNIDAGLPVKPTITSPKPDDTVPGHVIITGKAAPNATLQIDVMFKSPALFGVFANTGKAASTQVVADAKGLWHTDDLKLTAGGLLGTAKGTTYTATAVVVDATGQQSEADEIVFRQG